MELSVRTPVQGVVDITAAVQELITRAGLRNGLCALFVQHTSAAVFVNEDDGRIPEDLFAVLEQLIPAHAGYRHDAVDGNAHAHLKASILGPSLTLPVEDGRLALGTWQQVLLAEFDGPRERRLRVTLLAEQ